MARPLVGLMMIGLCVMINTMVNGECHVVKELGCYNDYTDGANRVMDIKVDDNMQSWADCASKCNAAGQASGKNYNVAGGEAGHECWCAESTTCSPRGTVADETLCKDMCAGDTSQSCGAGYLLYEFTFECDKTSYNCVIGTCTPDACGTYTSLFTCSSSCGNTPGPPPPPSPTPATKSYKCDAASQSCQNVPEGTGGSALTTCQDACVPAYTCDVEKDTYTCTLAAPGTKDLLTKESCKSVCAPRQKKKSDKLTAGSILLLVFFVGLVIPYFVIGTLFMHFHRGASGTDAIPNKDFWTELPSLIKDGAVFLIAKIRDPFGKGSGAYESIK